MMNCREIFWIVKCKEFVDCKRILLIVESKVAEITDSLSQKSWTQTNILGLNIRYLVAILRFVAFYSLFGRLWAFWVKYSVYWARKALLHGM